MENLDEDEQERLKQYTGRFKALWENYIWQKEAIEHRKNAIGMEETPEEEAMHLDYIKCAKDQPWNLEE
jgi:hypothetical protein